MALGVVEHVRSNLALTACCIVMASVAMGLSAHAVAAAPASSSQIVLLVDGTPAAAVADAMAIVPTNTYDSALNGFSADLTAAQIATLKADPRVRSVARNRTLREKKTKPVRQGNDVPQIVSREARRVGLLDSVTAHVGGPGRSVDSDIAILDSGIDPRHPDLKVVGGYDCTSVHRQRWSDDNGHGTMVAGIAAARDNRIDVVGVAPGARLWAIKVLDADNVGTDASVLCGIDWVAANAGTVDVANMSFGGQPDGSQPGQRFDDPTCGRSTGDILHSAVCRAVRRGVVLVAGAGNDSADAAESVPAAYPEVITVSGMVDSDGQPGGLGGLDPCLGQVDDTLASFSNFGSPVDIAAPAVCVSTTYPEPDAVAVDSGTSFAAPFVTGAVSLIRATHGSIGPQRVKELLLANAGAAPLAGDPDALPEDVLNVAGF